MRQTAKVTDEQLELVWRVIDGRTGKPFYRVQSESDPTKDYTVRAIRVRGKYFCTCTCQSGMEAFLHASGTCKHVRWCLAHARRYKEENTAKIVERFPIPNSTLVFWTVREGTVTYQVMQSSTGCTCDCYGFWYETGPDCNPPSRARCCHIEAVKAEIAHRAQQEQEQLLAA